MIAAGMIWVTEWSASIETVNAAFLALVYSDYLLRAKSSLTCSGYNYQPDQLRHFAYTQVCYCSKCNDFPSDRDPFSVEVIVLSFILSKLPYFHANSNVFSGFIADDSSWSTLTYLCKMTCSSMLSPCAATVVEVCLHRSELAETWLFLL